MVDFYIVLFKLYMFPMNIMRYIQIIPTALFLCMNLKISAFLWFITSNSNLKLYLIISIDLASNDN